MTALRIASTAKTLNDVLSAGFVVTRFSTKDCTIMVSKDSTAKVIIENGKAKVYSTRDNKEVNKVSALVDIH
jgi:hypothetical protein